MKIKSALIFVLLFGCANLLSAQILNVEKARLDSLSLEKPYRISFESRFNIYNRSATENEKAEFINISNKLSAVFSPKKRHAYVIMGSTQLTQNNGIAILNNAYLHIRSTFNFKRRWSPELFAQIQDDQFRGLRNRKLMGGAVRYKGVDSKKIRLVLAAGPMFESEDWINVETQEERNLDLWKLNSYFLFRWDINSNINFNTIFYYQVGYDSSEDIYRQRVSNSSNLNFKLAKFLSFTFTIEMAYENEPIFPITELIYSIENGLTLSF